MKKQKQSQVVKDSRSLFSKEILEEFVKRGWNISGNEKGQLVIRNR